MRKNIVKVTADTSISNSTTQTEVKVAFLTIKLAT